MKKISDIERITGWFTSAPAGEATVLLSVIQGIMRSRIPRSETRTERKARAKKQEDHPISQATGGKV